MNPGFYKSIGTVVETLKRVSGMIPGTHKGACQRCMKIITLEGRRLYRACLGVPVLSVKSAVAGR